MLDFIRKVGAKLYRLRSIFYSKKKMHSMLFKMTHTYEINWDKPETYDEKLHYVMVTCMGKEEARFADKIKVRNYVRECGYESFLPQIYGVWDKADDVNLTNLPEKFVLKTNHACGEQHYLLCKDKNIIDWEKELLKFRKALKTQFWKCNYEYHYKYIQPKVYAEELLESGDDGRLTDYKVHCFSGKPYCILVCTDRDKELKLDFYDTEWNYMEICPKKYRSGRLLEKPAGLEKMLEASAELSKIFPAARIDFYNIEEKVYFGEITLTPGAGNLYYINEKYQKIMGDMFEIPADNIFTKY